MAAKLEHKKEEITAHNTDNMGKLFVTLFAFVSAPKTNSLWPLYPDTRICTQLKPCTMTNFWLRDSLYRDTAQVPIYQIPLPGSIPGHLATLYRDTRNAQLNLYHDGKKCAIPSLHRDHFAAKETGPCPVLASGNTTSPYCRAVSVHLWAD